MALTRMAKREAAGTQGLVVCGRVFSPEDLVTIRGIIAGEPRPNRREIASRTCQALGWLRVDGRLKEMICRVGLLRFHRRGLITLPPPLKGNGNRTPYRPQQALIAPPEPIDCGIREFVRIEVVPVGRPADSRLWNETIERFHYLGHKRLPGAQMRYLIRSDRGLLGAIGFGASAWKVAPRDRWIGWTH